VLPPAHSLALVEEFTLNWRVAVRNLDALEHLRATTFGRVEDSSGCTIGINMDLGGDILY